AVYPMLSAIRRELRGSSLSSSRSPPLLSSPLLSSALSCILSHTPRFGGCVLKARLFCHTPPLTSFSLSCPCTCHLSSLLLSSPPCTPTPLLQRNVPPAGPAGQGEGCLSHGAGDPGVRRGGGGGGGRGGGR